MPIDYRASPDFLARVSRIVAAKLVLIGQDVPPFTRAGRRAGLEAARARLDRRRRPPPPAVAIARDDVAEIIFTSGATAEPKGVVITHRNVLANIVPVEREVLKYRKWGRPFFPLRFLNLLPLSHMFGQAMATFIPPMLPGIVVFMRGYNPGEIVAQIKTRRISVLVSVPKILDVLREHVLRVALGTSIDDAPVRAGKQHFAERWWRYRHVHRLFGLKFWAFVVGAAPLDAELEAFWGELGFVVIQGYGLTETAPIVTLNHPFGTKKGSVGKAIAGVEVKIAADGEILVRGENVTTRLLQRGRGNRARVRGRLVSHRRHRRDRRRRPAVHPRPQEGNDRHARGAERLSRGCRARAEPASPACATRRSSACRSDRRERVHAVLVLDPGIDADAVVREANAQLDDHQKIRRALVWPEPELPRTEGTRKLKRAAIRDWVQSGGAAPRLVAGRRPTRSPRWSRSTPAARISRRTTTLEELGLSSLERVELMVALEDAFQTRIDEGAFAEARDVGQLRTLVERARDERRAAGRAGRLPGVEAGRGRRARVPPREPADLDSAAGARVRVDARRGPRAPARISTGR